MVIRVNPNEKSKIRRLAENRHDVLKIYAKYWFRKRLPDIGSIHIEYSMCDIPRVADIFIFRKEGSHIVIEVKTTQRDLLDNAESQIKDWYSIRDWGGGVSIGLLAPKHLIHLCRKKCKFLQDRYDCTIIQSNNFDFTRLEL